MKAVSPALFGMALGLGALLSAGYNATIHRALIDAQYTSLSFLLQAFLLVVVLLLTRHTVRKHDLARQLAEVAG
ncbi:MAG: hypothetical protein MHM6MM_007887 [Cercozoa sp. M6MM]